jgi:hypothetical protein
MKNIRFLPEQEERVETGPVQFGGDWPGVFVRGDNCFYYSMILKSELDKLPESINKTILKTLCDILDSSKV